MTDTPTSAPWPTTGGPVIVGIDGSANSRRAVDLAADLAEAFDVDLAVFHALGLMTVIEGEHVPTVGHRDDIERLLRTDWCAALAARPDLRWRAELVYGNPASVLLGMAAEYHASFVVVGSRGLNDEHALGSTSHHIVHHAECPVVVVPPAADG
jgi:nucleotide-binding universal stress UspA family protein